MPPGTRLELCTAQPVMVTDCIHQAVSTGQLGPEPKSRECLIMGVNRVHAEGFYALSTELSVTSSQEITVLAICRDPPHVFCLKDKS